MYGDDGHTEAVQAENAAYRAGLRARAKGLPRSANPHPQNAPGLWPEWDAGWMYENDGPDHAPGCSCAYCAEPGVLGVDDYGWPDHEAEREYE